ncbi:hypothetical protein BDP27DRAFT_1339101 [Rhodocollybia butyracea]|uniref:Uncharacterized protein n=1 Tax=Rhodocollybia butyracea TaxID=206335 RepID=A0A9P5PC80_9AGAR|nr:hypothetical protein BDP27DRAFT_1339101 [Rhodocollybia butyracea]
MFYFRTRTYANSSSPIIGYVFGVALQCSVFSVSAPALGSGGWEFGIKLDWDAHKIPFLAHFSSLLFFSSVISLLSFLFCPLHITLLSEPRRIRTPPLLNLLQNVPSHRFLISWLQSNSCQLQYYYGILISCQKIC